MGRRRGFLALLASVVSLAVAVPIGAADLKDGLEAYCAKRLPEAFQILAPLAEKGDRDAQVIMGLRYFHGMDGKTDLRLARKWYAKAAEQGDTWAQANLGNLYFSLGESGPSRVVGCKWLTISSGGGDTEAQKLLEQKRSLITADERSEAERQAGQFEPHPTTGTLLVTRRCRPDSTQASKKTKD